MQRWEGNKLTINNVFEKFMSRFPQINDDINKNLSDNMVDTNDGIYVVWGMGVMPCVINMIDNVELYENQISSIFDFFEDMANGEEDELKELLMYSTLETLGDDEKWLKISRQFMKNETKLLSESIKVHSHPNSAYKTCKNGVLEEYIVGQCGECTLRGKTKRRFYVYLKKY